MDFVIIENLSATPTWRSLHVAPADMTSLRRRWPKAVFNTLRRRASDVECLRRDAPKRADNAFRYSGPGFCGVCDTRIYSALDAHMIAYHYIWSWASYGAALSLGAQYGRGRDVPVRSIWRKSTGDRRWRSRRTLPSFFPPWTVTRDVWLAALRPDVSGVAVDALLFHEAGRRTTNVAKFFSAMDCDSRRLARCPPSGRIRGRCGRPAVSRGRTPLGSSLPGLYGPVSPSSTPQRRHSSPAVLHRPAHSSANFDPFDWGSSESGAAGVFSGEDGPSPAVSSPPCVIRG